jgi:hypothetical protein
MAEGLRALFANGLKGAGHVNQSARAFGAELEPPSRARPEGTNGPLSRRGEVGNKDHEVMTVGRPIPWHSLAR